MLDNQTPIQSSPAPAAAETIAFAAPATALLLSPLDDPRAWLKAPAMRAPSGVDVERCMRLIDGIFGTTRNGEPIMKLVWNGDRRYWHELYMSWDAGGRPNAPLVRRPRVRHKALRGRKGKLQRDIFPPRWLILCRLEPEQYADRYALESWVFDPHDRIPKQMRPDDPPPVYWLWFMTIAVHNDHCCTTAGKDKRKCFGKYAPPGYAYEALGRQKQSDLDNGIKLNPFEKIGADMMRLVEAQNNAYEHEITELQIEKEIFTENPLALIGPAAAMKLNLDTPAKARRVVEEYYDRKLQEAGREKRPES